MAADISFSCQASPQAEAGMAADICREFRAALAEKFPGHSFDAETGAPGLTLTILRANARALALEATWIAADGSRNTGPPLSTAFFDRNSDEQLRRRFYNTFLEQNPLPF